MIRLSNVKEDKSRIVWLTNISTSVGAVVGGLWFYLLRGYPCPNVVYLLRALSESEELGEETNSVLSVMEKLNKVFCGGKMNIVLKDTWDNFLDYDRDLGDFLLGVASEDALVFDFSPGRKYMAISMVKYLLDIQRGIKEKSGPFSNAKFRDIRILNLFLTRYKELYGGNFLLTDFPIWAFDFIMAKNVLNDTDIIKRNSTLNIVDSSELDVVVPRYKLMNLLNAFAYGKCLDSEDFNECRKKNKLYLSLSSVHYDGAFMEIELDLSKDSATIKLPYPRVNWKMSNENERKFECERGEDIDFLNILYMSGVRQPEGYGEIIEKLNEFNRRRPVMGTRPGIVAFDTDAFKYQIPYRVARYIEQRRIQNTGILLLNPVKMEIAHHLDRFKESKYRENDLQKLSELFAKPMSEIGDYLNIECKERRYWWLASQLFKHLEGQNYTTIIGEEKRGDDAIIKAIREYQNNNRTEVVLVTFDAELSDRATAKGILTILLRHPDAPKRSGEIETHWWEAMETLYYASVIFAKIRINALSKATDVEGYWRRKNRQKPYTEDTVRILTKSKKLAELAKKIILIDSTKTT